MNRPPASVAAFTLIEMMIAVGLGSLIIMVAMAGFRTASQTVTVANRLSLENSLLRAGYFEAQIQLDRWTNYDDPTKPDAERPLKANAARGFPFTPMTDLQMSVWPKAGTNPRVTAPTPLTSPSGALGNFILPGPPAANIPADWEGDKGWDPTYSWSPHDPRTWSRANLAEKDRGNGGHGNDGSDYLPPFISGRYAIFANTSSSAQTLASYSIRPDRNNADVTQQNTLQSVSYSSYPETGIHTWYYNQLDGLINAMGYAAFCDYLPANAIYTWYSDHSNRTIGGINLYGVSPGYGFTNGDGDQRSSRGIYRNTYSVSFGYMNPRATTGQATSGFYRHFNSDYGATDNGGAADLQLFLKSINFPEPLQAIKPTNWPEIDVSVGRLIKNAHFVAVAKVRRFSPLSGELIELSWTGLGTTLRGARMQRHQSSGWAHWDNRVGATIDPTLDTPRN